MKPRAFDPSTLNMINPDKEKSIFDPNSEFIRELELTKARLNIRPRKVNMMLSQIGMITDMMSEDKAKKLYVPHSGAGNKGGFVLK